MGCHQRGGGERKVVEGQGRRAVFVLSPVSFCFVDHEDPINRKRRE